MKPIYFKRGTHERKRIEILCLVLSLIIFSPPLASDSTPPLKIYKKVMILQGGDGNRLNMPTDIAIGEKRNIYIIDSGNHRIQVYADDGTFLYAFGSKGKQEGRLDSPVGIDISAEGKVYVADRGNKRIQVYDSQGRFLKTLATVIGKSRVSPVDVAIDNAREIILVSVSSPCHCILVYNLDGTLVNIWGKPGNNHGEFRYPATITTSRQNELYIVDVFNSRVQVLNEKGKFIVTVGSWGVTPGNLFRPKGVALQNDGIILVSDSYLGVIQLYNTDTRFDSVLGIDGEIARFDTPAGITVDANNQLYVAEMLANRVTVLRPVQHQ